jgi:dipeptidyl aminopeptidase/acylaminoacyl peptidase
MPRRRAAKTLTFSDLMSIPRISLPAVSPDGIRVAYQVSRPDPKENKTRHTIRILDLTTLEDRELTPGPGNHMRPAWSPDGRWLAFASDREEKSGTQLWVLPMNGLPGPGEARRVTSGYGGVGQPLWAPDSRRIAFSRSVVVSENYRPRRGQEPDPKTGPTRAEVYGLINPKSSARIADQLLFRHWDTWRDRRRNHLFIVDVVSGAMDDITPYDCDAPPISLGSERDYDFRPDGREIAFVMNPDAVVARSTNNSVFLQALRGTRAVGEAVCISETHACDIHPRYSSDGSRVFYLGMEVPGYEADRNRIKVYDRVTRRTRVYLERFDRSPSAFEIAPSLEPQPAGGAGKRSRRGTRHAGARRAASPETAGSMIFLAQDRGRQSVYRLDLASGKVAQLTLGTYNGLFRVIPGTGSLLVMRETTTQPADLYRLEPGKGFRPFLETGPLPPNEPLDAGAPSRRLTTSGDILSGVSMNPAEEYWYAGAGGDWIHGFLIKPPGFRAGRRYPLILLIHGGPQSSFMDQFHYRWNAQMFATRGAVVAFVNPRGSTGYGQKLTDQISGDWGGRCFEDIMLGVDHLLDRYRFIDPKRMAAAGASFGGFMVNWIAGHTGRFRALVSHDGVFSAETMGYTTEELWFDEHEHGGLPHDARASFLKSSPHLFVKNFKTPTLVIHGEQDFRCPISEGIGLFTALQVRGVPSRFLEFPDEGHWVMQPANAEVWYREVSDWLMKWLG